jgi:hypothetical protein
MCCVLLLPPVYCCCLLCNTLMLGMCHATCLNILCICQFQHWTVVCNGIEGDIPYCEQNSQHMQHRCTQHPIQGNIWMPATRQS